MSITTFIPIYEYLYPDPEDDVADQEGQEGKPAGGAGPAPQEQVSGFYMPPAGAPPGMQWGHAPEANAMQVDVVVPQQGGRAAAESSAAATMNLYQQNNYDFQLRQQQLQLLLIQILDLTQVLD